MARIWITDGMVPLSKLEIIAARPKPIKCLGCGHIRLLDLTKLCSKCQPAKTRVFSVLATEQA